jgi:hypothetical protein
MYIIQQQQKPQFFPIPSKIFSDLEKYVGKCVLVLGLGVN